jgi:DNA-binding XRE family transcriptional regulator
MQEQNTSYRQVERSDDSCLFIRLVRAVPKFCKPLGESIRLYRKKAKLTQERLAELADLNPKYLGEIERGENTASLSALVRIAKAVGVRVRDLVAEI